MREQARSIIEACGQRIERELAGESRAFAAGDLELAAQYAEAAEGYSALAFIAARCVL